MWDAATLRPRARKLNVVVLAAPLEISHFLLVSVTGAAVDECQSAMGGNYIEEVRACAGARRFSRCRVYAAALFL